MYRTGQPVNILTGPPQYRSDDSAMLARFVQRPGLKIVCGGTTAKLVANYLDVPLLMESEPTSEMTPPQYGIRGINLATEGMVTLNQVYAILDADYASITDYGGATRLRWLLGVADTLHIIVGLAKNTAHTDALFCQRGLLPRKVLIPLLAEKLRNAGKLVNVEFI
ncbi:MAG: hypothetical protein FWG73_06775 [Planctomycetaceae bacterium]|nr:hypothetical protein [Planctomycetaceae bacterium]